jgi:hypothetical protein
MGYDFDGFDFDDDNRGADNSNGPKALREALKAAQTRVRELEEANGQLEQKVASRSLQDVLTKKDLPQGLGRFILQDKVDPSDELAVNKWLHDNQSVFGFQLKTEGQGGGTDDAAGSEGANEHEEYAANLARIQGASNGAMPDNRFSQAADQIRGETDMAKIQAALDAAIANAH